MIGVSISDASDVAAQIEADIRALPVQNSAAMRVVRRQYSDELEGADPAFVLAVAKELIAEHEQRGLAYELIRYHKPTFQMIGASELEELGQGINNWHSVDGFARILAGPAWLYGQVPDELIFRWVGSDDLWWRRAALVSTVALNVRSHGGMGDIHRTLAACALLVSDHEDMVVKAMSWALRELVVHDADAVAQFVDEHEGELAARVKREVRNKITTGLKVPKRMKAYIALLRGINVGGNTILPMKELRTLLEDLGADSVKTYIQSGNAVFEHSEEDVDKLSSKISTAIQESHGFEPRVLLLRFSEMEKAIAANPFPEAESEPKSLHFYFLAATPQEPDLEMLDSLKKENERFQLLDNVFYLHAPDGIGRSKLAERVERALGVPATARNWRTVSKTMDLTKAHG